MYCRFIYRGKYKPGISFDDVADPSRRYKIKNDQLCKEHRRRRRDKYKKLLWRIFRNCIYFSLRCPRKGSQISFARCNALCQLEARTDLLSQYLDVNLNWHQKRKKECVFTVSFSELVPLHIKFYVPFIMNCWFWNYNLNTCRYFQFTIT